MQVIDQIRKELSEKGVPVLKLSKETGISAYKIYKWLDGKANPKHEDVLLLEKWLSGDVENVPTGNSDSWNVQEPGRAYNKNPGEPGPASEAVLLREIIKLKDQIIAMQSKENSSLQEQINAVRETTVAINEKVEGCNLLIQENNRLSKEANELTRKGNEFLKALEGLAELGRVARDQDPSENRKDKKQDGKGSPAKNK